MANDLTEVEDFLAFDPSELGPVRKDERKNFHIVLVSLFSFNSFPVHTLGSLLRSKGFKVSYVFFKSYRADDMTLPTKEEYEILMKLLSDLAPDLIGLTIFSSFVHVAKEITKLARPLGVPIAWGGAAWSRCI